MAEIPDIVIWAIVLAVIIQGLSMALLVYLMYQRYKEGKKVTKPEPPEKPAVRITEKERP